MTEKRKTSLLVAAILTLGIAIPLAYYHRQEIRFPALSIRSNSREPDTRVGAVFVAKIGEKHLRLSFVVLVEDKDHQEELLQKMPMIKNDLVLSADRPHVALSFELRDFDILRECILGIINRHTSRPVNTLYFESYHFD